MLKKREKKMKKVKRKLFASSDKFREFSINADNDGDISIFWQRCLLMVS
jgi:hypothetical protein